MAAERSGWRTIGFSEIDPYASAVLRKHWPDVPNYGDIRNVRGIHAELVTGGFPCTPFSLAGKRRGKEDDRYLWPEMHRVIAETRPTWVLAENVPGIISMELDRVLSDLESLGYTSGTLVIPACAVDARHRRDRVWIVAHTKGFGCSKPRHENKQNGEGWDSVKDRTGDFVSDVDCKRLSPSWRCQASTGASSQDIVFAATIGFPGSESYPDLLRDVHGIRRRMDRIKCLGNSIVPQVAEVILRAMIKVHTGELEKP